VIDSRRCLKIVWKGDYSSMLRFLNSRANILALSFVLLTGILVTFPGVAKANILAVNHSISSSYAAEIGYKNQSPAIALLNPKSLNSPTSALPFSSRSANAPLIAAVAEAPEAEAATPEETEEEAAQAKAKAEKEAAKAKAKAEKEAAKAEEKKAKAEAKKAKEAAKAEAKRLKAEAKTKKEAEEEAEEAAKAKAKAEAKAEKEAAKAKAKAEKEAEEKSAAENTPTEAPSPS
jgi:hypothetical protein